MEAAKGFRRLKAHKQLPILKTALAAHRDKHATKQKLAENRQARIASSTGNAHSAEFKKRVTSPSIPDTIRHSGAEL
jgi:hypothetical protein